MSGFSFEYTLTKSDCDNVGRISLSSLLELFCNAAIYDYENAGLSRDKLESENFRFLLVQTAVKINALPVCDDTVIVSTEEVGISGAFFDRRYNVFSLDKTLLITADSRWVLTDTSHRPMSPKKFPYKIAAGNKPEIECERMKKYSLSDFSGGTVYKVKKDFIDQNNHVHNSVYADVALSLLPENFWQKNWLGFSINWRREAVLGDSWQLFTSSSADVYSCVGFIDDKNSFDFFLYTESAKTP